MRRTPRFVAFVAAAATVLAGCSLSNREIPYASDPPPPSAVDALEHINLAQYGLRAYPCDLFSAQVARCYRPDAWLSVREGRETLAHIHRELVSEGARFWGGVDSSIRGVAHVAAGLDLGCYFDYETLDYVLRVAVVGPTGEAQPCVNGLPGDGVSEVWIVGVSFDAFDTYRRVQLPDSLESVLLSLPAPAPAAGRTYGGPNPTEDGYIGPALPAADGGTGVRIVAETVAVRDGVARGLVQYRGAGPDASATTGAIGIVVAAGTATFAVPIVVRPGESAPFEVTLPAGLGVEDLEVLPGWSRVEDDWRGAQVVGVPAARANCAAGATIDGEPIGVLAPPAGQVCDAIDAQPTTEGRSRVFVDAMAALFNTDGTVRDVFPVVVINADGGVAGVGRASGTGLDFTVAWVAPSGQEGSAGVWVRYVRATDFALGGPSDPAAAAAQ